MRVGIVGATGQVGGVVRSILAERQFPVSDLRCFASARSTGRRLPWGTDEVAVENADEASYDGLDVVLMSAGGATSRRLAERALNSGAYRHWISAKPAGYAPRSCTRTGYSKT